MRLFHLAFFFFYICIIKFSDSVLSILMNGNNGLKSYPLYKSSARKFFLFPNIDVENSRKVRENQKSRRIDSKLKGNNASYLNLILDSNSSEEPQHYWAKKYPKLFKNSRRIRQNLLKHVHPSISESSKVTSTSEEVKIWKKEYSDKWRQLKADAIASLLKNETYGGAANMAAIRPWKVPCGDPNQHDIPWGTCMLPYECQPEFRIYRGDAFCGRSRFVCCSLQISQFDLYQGFDVSLTDSSGFSTSSEEKLKKYKSSKEKRRLKYVHRKNRMLRERQRRKRNMKKTIRSLAKEIRKELNRAFRNHTRQRGQTSYNMMMLLKNMKKRFRKERQMANVNYHHDLVATDTKFIEGLGEVRQLNLNFLKNSTFREIIVNQSLTNKDVHKILEVYPELKQDPELADLDTNDTNDTRRSSGRKRKHKDYLEYDIEFGLIDL